MTYKMAHSVTFDEKGEKHWLISTIIEGHDKIENFIKCHDLIGTLKFLLPKEWHCHITSSLQSSKKITFFQIS